MNVNVMDKWSQENGGLRSQDRTIERARTAELAHHLSTVALRQWEKALTGIVALPAALALGVAASATYAVALLERGFEVFESAVGEVGRTLTRDDAGHERRERTERGEARA
jgi:hypothetical protein